MSDKDRLPFETQGGEDAEGTKVEPGTYGDPDSPLSASKIPPHLKSFVTIHPDTAPNSQSGGGATNEDDGDGIITGVSSASIDASDDDDDPEPVRTVDVNRGVGLPQHIIDNPNLNVLNPADIGEEETRKNVIGMNPATERPIVTPNKDSGSVFKTPEVDTSQAQSFGSFEEIMRHARDLTDFRPMNLVSNGYLYPARSQFSNGKVLVRPMRSEEEEIMMSPNLIKDGDAIEMLLKRCVILDDQTQLHDPAELLVQDRTFLLIAIRGRTYGPEYDAAFTCNRCGFAFEVKIDLDGDLDHVFCNDPDIKEPFTTVLPHSNVLVTYVLPRGREDLAIYKHIQNRQKKKGPKAKEDALRVKAGMLVKSVGGYRNPEQIQKFLKTISAQDLRHLRGCFDYPPFGVDTRLSVDCPSCGGMNKTRLPMSIDFFTPSSEKLQSSEESHFSEQD